MPKIFDNIDLLILPVLQETLKLSDRAGFYVGYNLRGWKAPDKHITHWSETEGVCSLLIGMQKPPHDQLREVLSLMADE